MLTRLLSLMALLLALVALLIISPGADAETNRYGACKQSESIGTSMHGSLRYGVRLSNTDDFLADDARTESRASSDRTRWATCRVVGALDKAVAEYRRSEGAPRVLVGDLSRRYGGPIAGHFGHQNGRQADLLYPRQDGREVGATAATLHPARTRALISAVLASGARQVVIGLDTPAPKSKRIVRLSPYADHLHVEY